MTIRYTRLIARIGGVLLLGMPFAASVAQSPEQAQTSQCWSPQALAARAGEKLIHRVPYDPSIEPQTPDVHLAPLAAAQRGSIRGVRLPAGEKLVALTFDLCENAGEISGYDGEIIDTLRALGAKATFFPSGKWLLDHKERAQQLITDPLFQVGGHSWTHLNFRLMSQSQVEADLALDLKADTELRQSLRGQACTSAGASQYGDKSHATLFRFPFGTCNAESLKAVNDAGLIAIQWDVVSGDPAPAQGAEAIRRGVVAAAKPGSIVVMHANGRGWHTSEALPLVIEDLRKRGFEFATVGELLSKGEPIVADSCYELKPGDNVKYDKLFPLTARPKPQSHAANAVR